MKKFVLLLTASFLFLGCQKATSISIPNPVTQATLASSSDTSLPIPPGETLLAFENFFDGQFIMVTSPLPTDEDAYAHVKIWIKSGDAENFQLLKEETLGGVTIQKIGLRWDEDSTTQDNFLDIQFNLSGDGPFISSEFDDIYIDIQNKKVMASSSWVTPYNPEFSLNNGQKKYVIQLQAQNSCEIDFHDAADALLINNQSLKFKKVHPISCQKFGEGEIEPMMIQLGAPSFHDGHFVTFNLPWGTSITIDLEKQSVHSNDLVNDFDLKDLDANGNTVPKEHFRTSPDNRWKVYTTKLPSTGSEEKGYTLYIEGPNGFKKKLAEGWTSPESFSPDSKLFLFTNLVTLPSQPSSNSLFVYHTDSGKIERVLISADSLELPLVWKEHSITYISDFQEVTINIDTKKITRKPLS